jgi:hypothetical protein
MVNAHLFLFNNMHHVHSVIVWHGREVHFGAVQCSEERNCRWVAFPFLLFPFPFSSFFILLFFFFLFNSLWLFLLSPTASSPFDMGFFYTITAFTIAGAASRALALGLQNKPLTSCTFLLSSFHCLFIISLSFVYHCTYLLFIKLFSLSLSLLYLSTYFSYFLSYHTSLSCCTLSPWW